VAHSSIHVLELGLERDTHLRSDRIGRRQRRAGGSTRIQQDPASMPSTTSTTPQSVSAAPALDRDAHGLEAGGPRPAAAAREEDPKAPHGASATAYLDRPQRVDGSGATAVPHDLGFGCRRVGARFLPAEVLCRGSIMVSCLVPSSPRRVSQGTVQRAIRASLGPSYAPDSYGVRSWRGAGRPSVRTDLRRMWGAVVGFGGAL
jgi:hypothetical protein